MICKSGKSADFPDLLFHGRGRGGKRHICDMQFADVACALKTQTAINFQSPHGIFSNSGIGILIISTKLFVANTIHQKYD